MFRVPTYLARSPIHGIGVFTPFPIDAGTLIWDFTPEVDLRLTAGELEEFPEPYLSRLRNYCYLEPSGLYVLCGDNARFMNHSADPSCDDQGTTTRAGRDIAAGEELTCDYRAFDMEATGDAAPEYLLSSVRGNGRRQRGAAGE